MNKSLLFISLILLNAASVWAQQTMWVCVGNVKYAYATETVGKMPYGDTQLNILGKTYALNEVDSICVNNEELEDDNIIVTYSGNTAQVKVAGNIASRKRSTCSSAARCNRSKRVHLHA